ncbi:hypothetical protein ACOMHN_058423 [Nucella lapillus]
MTTVQVLSQDVLVACILLGLTALVGLLGNALMVRALLRYSALRVDFFLVLGSVAMADILCLIIAVPRNIIDLTMPEYPPLTDEWCKASKYLEVGAGFVAAYHLVLLAVLRTVLMTTRGTSPPSPLHTLLCAAALWLLALLAAIPLVGTVGEVGGLCHYTRDTDMEKDAWLVHSFSCFVPAAFIAAFYLATHLVSQRYFQDSYSPREKDTSRLVTAVVVSFVVCQLPYRVFDLYLLYKEAEAGRLEFPDEDALESLYIARNYLLCLAMADKAARPVIYSKVAPRLAEAFDEVINCTLCHRAYTQARSGRAGREAGKASNGHSARTHSTSSNAPLTGMADCATSDTTTTTQLTSAEELEIMPL